MFAKWIDEDQRFLFQDFDNGGKEITKERHAELFDAQQKSACRIVRDADGYPVIEAINPPIN